MIMMMDLMYVFIASFFILNTLSFYVMDYVSDRLMFEKTSQLTNHELSIYTFLRILTGISIIGIFVTVITNLCQNIIKLF